MRSIVLQTGRHLPLALVVLALGWAWPAGGAGVPGVCSSLAGTSAALAAVQRAATCDECRTSGKRAGFKQCCEMIGGEERCQWVKC